jgi:DNA polymerase V
MPTIGVQIRAPLRQGPPTHAGNLYTVFVSSIDLNHQNVVRVGRDSATPTAMTRASVAIGFGSPSGDTGVTRLDLNDILIKNPQASFLMRVAGSAMRETGIDSGDLLLVDRAITPAHGHVVIAIVDEEFVCRRLYRQGQDMRLQATQPGCADIVAGEGMELQLWGIVTQVIKSMPV